MASDVTLVMKRLLYNNRELPTQMHYHGPLNGDSIT
jgi:hypothetical protein